MMIKFSRLFRSLGACAGAIILLVNLAGEAAAQEKLHPSGDLDCVAQPKSTLKLAIAEEGIITGIEVDRGDKVKKGQVLARLDSRLQRLALKLAEIKVANMVDVESGQARLEFRRSEMNRAEKLHKKKILATKTRDEAAIETRLAEFALRTAEMDREVAQVELDRAKTGLELRTIRSSVNGVVVKVSMSVGEYAYVQAPIMTIARINPLHVEVFVPNALYGSIKVGMTAEVRLEQPVGGVYQARVTVVDQVFDSASRTFGVRLELPNPDYGLPAGINCTVRFKADQTKSTATP